MTLTGDVRNGPDQWSAVASVSAASFVLVLSEFIAVAILPDVAERFSVTEGTAGLSVVLPGLVAAVAAPLATVLTGRQDRRLVLIGLTTVIVVANALSALAPSFAVLLLARALLGVAVGGFWSIGAGAGVYLVSPHQVGRATSFITAGIAAGTVISLPLGRVVGDRFGAPWVFSLAAGGAALVALFQAAALPRMPVRTVVHWSVLTRILRAPGARAGLLIGGLLFAAHFTAYTFITPFLTGHAHLPASSVGPLLLVFGLAGLVGNFMAGWAVARNLPGTLVAAVVLLGTATALLDVAQGARIAVAAMVVVWGLSWGAIPIAVQTYMMEVGGSEASLALFVSTAQVSLALGSVVGGRLVDRVGLTFDFAFTSVLAGAAVLLVLALMRPERVAA